MIILYHDGHLSVVIIRSIQFRLVLVSSDRQRWDDCLQRLFIDYLSDFKPHRLSF